MDRMLRAEIIATVKKTMCESMEIYNEKWLSADQLCEQFGMFSKDWLKHYGETLPRERVEVTDGCSVRCSRWAYPLHRIQRMLLNRELKNLKINSVCQS